MFWGYFLLKDTQNKKNQGVIKGLENIIELLTPNSKENIFKYLRMLNK